MRSLPEIAWLTKAKDIPNAPMDCLLRSILTSDGAGRLFKEAVLEEIIKRSIRDFLIDIAQGVD